MSRGRAVWTWGALLAYAVALFAAGSHPNPPGGSVANDKLLHAAAYAVFALLAWRALRGVMPCPPVTALASVALVVLHGGAMELQQRAIPGRCGSVGDLVADLVGAGLGLALQWLLALGRRGGS